MEFTDSYGRIVEVSEIVQEDLKDWMKRSHSAGEVLEKLKLDQSANYFDQVNVTDEDKDFSAKEFANAEILANSSVQIFEQDKLKEIAKNLKKSEDGREIC